MAVGLTDSFRFMIGALATKFYPEMKSADSLRIVLFLWSCQCDQHYLGITVSMITGQKALWKSKSPLKAKVHLVTISFIQYAEMFL